MSVLLRFGLFDSWLDWCLLACLFAWVDVVFCVMGLAWVTSCVLLYVSLLVLLVWFDVFVLVTCFELFCG